MMLLLDAIEAEVVPAQDRANWFRLTGRNILLVDYPNAVDYIEDAEQAGYVVHRDVFIEGMHEERPESLETDPRFNGEYNEHFAVIEKNGQFTLVLDTNWPEAFLLRYLVKRRGYEDQPLPAPSN